jgi:hypothetical protein
MGFDCAQVPYLQHLINANGLRLEDIEVFGSELAREAIWDLARAHLDFMPPDGWSSLIGAR